jgi:hypothetical protein
MTINPMQSAHDAPRCKAKSKRTGKPCRAPAVRGCRVCKVPIGDIDFDYSIIGTGEVCFHPLPSSFLTIVLPLVYALMITRAAKAQGLCVDNGGLSRLNTRSWT